MSPKQIVGFFFMAIFLFFLSAIVVAVAYQHDLKVNHPEKYAEQEKKREENRKMEEQMKRNEEKLKGKREKRE